MHLFLRLVVAQRDLLLLHPTVSILRGVARVDGEYCLFTMNEIQLNVPVTLRLAALEKGLELRELVQGCLLRREVGGVRVLARVIHRTEPNRKTAQGPPHTLKTTHLIPGSSRSRRISRQTPSPGGLRQ